MQCRPLVLRRKRIRPEASVNRVMRNMDKRAGCTASGILENARFARSIIELMQAVNPESLNQSKKRSNEQSDE